MEEEAQLNASPENSWLGGYLASQFSAQPI